MPMQLLLIPVLMGATLGALQRVKQLALIVRTLSAERSIFQSNGQERLVLGLRP
jgi:hypothetical protein